MLDGARAQRPQGGPMFTVDELFEAAGNGNNGIVMEYIDSGGDIEVRDDECDGDSLLTYASVNDNEELCEFLLRNGANVNSQDVHGYSALHITYPRIAKLLIEYGADIEMTDHAMLTPLEFTARHHRKIGREVAKVLLKHGASHNDKVVREVFGDLIAKYGVKPLLVV